MSSDKPNNKASIHVSVRMFMPSSQDIPKFIEVFDDSLSSIQSFWVAGRVFTISDLDKGVYLVRLTLSSGVQEDVTVELNEAENKKLEINIAFHSPHETHEWAFFTKNISMGSSKSSNLKTTVFDSNRFQRFDGKMWEYSNHHWISKVLPQFVDQRVFSDGAVYNLQTNDVLSLLEISGEVCLRFL